MVKRQTVWLSTMMVLSLMLIGYYTMNNEPGITASKSSDGATSAITPDTGSSAPTSKAGDTSTSSSASGTDSAGSTTTTANSSDWYVEYQTQLKQQMEQQMDTYSQVLTNNNATTQQLSQAEQELNRLQALQGGLDNAHDAVVGEGFKDCVIVPNKDYTKFTVYVKTAKLTAEQAVQIMHTVSQQLNISAVNINVTPKA